MFATLFAGLVLGDPSAKTIYVDGEKGARTIYVDVTGQEREAREGRGIYVDVTGEREAREGRGIYVDVTGEREARGGEVRSPNPESNTGCRDSLDCKGTGYYCYPGHGGLKNYCAKDSGRNSLCRSDKACGWVGKGDYARKMYCNYNTGKCRDPGPPKKARGGQVRSPNPESNTQCRDSYDCQGVGVYCYPGLRGQPNYCMKGSGKGSVCTSNKSCGWIGKGSYAREMNCKYTSGRRRQDLRSPNPRPPSYKTCVDPGPPRHARAGDADVRMPNPEENTECESSYDCDGESEYCYEGHGGLPNYCKYGDGVGSLCTTDASCGWLGKGDFKREMNCEWVNSDDRRRMLPPQKKCVDPDAEGPLMG